ncbi:DNA-binding transcriptional regulator, CsgD family [Bradyrhizobium lablabi]|uniref:DNA-binding transcriptional regulator, CsgD family n=1 Tax=Bradyrhizobium lablabi TaxID=722472 RepID=A0A1M6RWH1_9BRAD|nr:helix-turn-helix transcriptional regulator [Bradyrhizobium lablabi]SHK36854.1 DNA-binding transcriptional regulator, CsgD family [Bradyrhizobium lablabi]
MSLGDDGELLDLIYEAAAVPEKWPSVLDRLAQLAGAIGTFLLTTDPHTLRWTSSESVRHLGIAFVEGGFHVRNPRMERLLKHKHLGFMREIDMFTSAEMAVDPTFQELLYPRGFGWAAGAVFQVPSDDMLAISIERGLAEGPIDDTVIARLNSLRPHLARAALMSARLRLERAQGMLESLTTMGLPSAVMVGDGKIVATSPLFEQAGKQIVSRGFGRIALTHSGANSLLSEAIEHLNSGEFQTGARSIPVPSNGDDAAMVIHLLPVRRSAHDIFGSAMAILVITPLGSPQSLPDDLLNGLFDLSPAESRAANGLLEGKTIGELAASLSLSQETIRSQVKAVFAKTGTTRQAELVSLLGNVGRPQWHPPQRTPN